jgi:hypothetical protein
MDYYDPDKRHLIDYVFVRRNGVKAYINIKKCKTNPTSVAQET